MSQLLALYCALLDFLTVFTSALVPLLTPLVVSL